MLNVGLDYHKSQSLYEATNEAGHVERKRSILGDWQAVVREMATLPKPLTICFEAGEGAGPLKDALEAIGAKVVVAHPGKTRMIFRAKRKNDRIDSHKLGKLLRLDEVPEAYIPAADVRSWRAMIEYRRRLLKRRTGVKNALRSLLRGCGKAGRKDLWTREGRAWLAAEPFASPLDALRRNLLLAELALSEEQVKTATKALDRIAEGDARIALLRTIPGVGVRTAEAVVAYVDDARRFPRAAAAGTYFGLVPCQDASAGVNRLGHITKEGPAAGRWLLCEAAWQGIRRSPTLRNIYERARKGRADRNKIAAVAVARHLAVVMVAMLKSGQAWRETVAVARPAA